MPNQTKPRILTPGRFIGKNLTLIEAYCQQHLEVKAMVPGKTINEYFRYLSASWDCICTRIARHGQMQLQPTTGPKRHCLPRVLARV